MTNATVPHEYSIELQTAHGSIKGLEVAMSQEQIAANLPASVIRHVATLVEPRPDLADSGATHPEDTVEFRLWDGLRSMAAHLEEYAAATACLEVYRISHRCELGDHAVFVARGSGQQVDVKRAAIYIQLMAEKWFGDHMTVSNLGIAAALVAFYGCTHAVRKDACIEIDMHDDRESLFEPDGEPGRITGTARELMRDPTLVCEGLRQYIAPHVSG